MPIPPSRLAFWLSILVSLVALAASAILLVDYVRPAPVFCAGDGGCSSVRGSALAYPLHVPMPLWGIAGLLAVALLALVPGRRARIGQAALAALGGIIAVGLLGWQIAHGTICPYCAVVDTSVVALALLSALRAVRAWDPPERRLHLGLAGSTMMLAVAAPAALGFALKPKPLPASVPPVIAEELARTPRGQITVIDFIDYECPFCRVTHAELAPLLRERRDKVRVVRKNVPLRMHAHALDAARAAWCAEELGKGEAMADALVATPTEQLTPEGGERLAAAQGLDLDRYRACVKSPETEARIKADGDLFRASQGHGLPTLWIHGTKLEGAQERETLRDALDAALEAL